jgi:hypothetical protein
LAASHVTCCENAWDIGHEPAVSCANIGALVAFDAELIEERLLGSAEAEGQ